MNPARVVVEVAVTRLLGFAEFFASPRHSNRGGPELLHAGGVRPAVRGQVKSAGSDSIASKVRM